MKWRVLVAGFVLGVDFLLVAAQYESSLEDEIDIPELENEMYEEAEVQEEDARWERRPFLEHRRHRKTSLFSEKPEVRKAINNPMMSSEEILPHRHPAIAQKLSSMDQDLHELQGRQQIAKESRGVLESDIKEAVHHMNKAVGIKHRIAKTQAQLRAESRRVRRLEDDRLRLDRTHGHLVSSLHHIMEPKINFAENRLSQRQSTAKELEEDSQKWKEKEQKYHSAAITMIEERKAVRKRLEDANEAIKKARREQELAEKELKAVKHSVDFNVEGFRYTKAKTRAAETKAETMEEEVVEDQKSVKRLNAILTLEQRRVDESMAHGKDKVQGKLRELASRKKHSSARLAKLEEEYHQWQQEEIALAHKVEAAKKRTREAAVQYNERHRDVLDAAQAKVAYDAESDSDWAWNEWPNKHNNEDEVHIEDPDPQSPDPQSPDAQPDQ